MASALHNQQLDYEYNVQTEVYNYDYDYDEVSEHTVEKGYRKFQPQNFQPQTFQARTFRNQTFQPKTSFFLKFFDWILEAITHQIYLQNMWFLEL